MVLFEPSDLGSNGDDSSADLFEFLTTSSEMCSADDVILSGKLLPFGAPPPARPQKPQTHIADFSDTDHRRWRSLGDQPRGCWGSKVTGVEYRKLRRVSDSEPKTKARPRWYVLAFRSVRVPAAMEMKEIRIRQRRRRAPQARRREEVAEDSGEWGPWKLLRSLSCQGTEAVIVA